MPTKINLIWVGKTKEQFIHEGIEKYLRLLRPYAEVTVVEVREEKGADIPVTMARESDRIVKLKMPYILMDESGRQMTSVDFSGFVGREAPRINFVLGGAYGVSDIVRKGAKEIISLSGMTLTHEMARVLLLEQLYRAFSIINRKGYHH